jgi:signal transduction histidine kinase/ActR/RegA family two-component response regulator
MTSALLSRILRRLEPHLLLFILYFVVGRVGLSISAPPQHGLAASVWIPGAVALAALLLVGYRLWPAVFFGAFILYASAGAGIVVSLLLAVAQTIEPLFGAYVLTRMVGYIPSLSRLRDNLGLVCVALVVPVIPASIATVTLLASHYTALGDALSIWVIWWSGSATSLLALGPALIKYLSRPIFPRTSGQYAELFAALVVVCGTALFIFWIPNNQFVYSLFIPLTWVALRMGPRGISTALALASVIAISGTLLDRGPYGHGDMLALNIFLITMSSLFLIFTSIVEERKEGQNELARHVDELEQALSKISSEDEAKKNFLAILAHELRNPLAAMLSSVELLRLQSADSEETPVLVRTIGDHVHAMRSMLDDVLDISRISRNKLSLHKEVIAVEAIVNRSVKSTEALFRQRQHRLSVRVPDGPLFVEADPIRTEQIMVNLLNNAAKYTNPGGTVALHVMQDKHFVVMSVKDNGIGISKAMQKRIFEPFFQVRRGKLATEGLGVGLPLVRNLVEMHGGTIEVKSEGEGKGSEFIVRLPLTRMRQKQVSIQPSPSPGRKLRFVRNTRTILVVDDNEAAAKSLSRLLELRGHTVSTVFTGNRAVEEARKEKPDIIVLDIGLPDIDGYEVVRQLTEDSAFPSSIIALTGYGQAEDKERALSAGFHYHLTKPVGLKELERAFKKVEKVAAE